MREAQQGTGSRFWRWTAKLLPPRVALPLPARVRGFSVFPLLEPFSASHQNLVRLMLIRLLVLLAQAVTVVAVWATHLLQLPWAILHGILLLSLAWCLLTLLRLRRPWPVTELEYGCQLGFDLLIHSLLLYFSGGAGNPFVAYYLVPLTIAATTLPWAYTLTLFGLMLLAYSLLLFCANPINTATLGGDTLLISSLWLSVVLAGTLITFFVAHMAEALRRQDLLRAEHSEVDLRDQQLMAVASQAAGAAHELGTPLSTMSVLLSELRREYQDPHLQEDLALLQQQVAQCKHSLQQLVRAAESDCREPPRLGPVDQWLRAVIDRWHLMRPEVTYTYQQRLGPAPSLVLPADLGQALLNLLNNAADANPEDIHVSLQWDLLQVTISIHDHGQGVPVDFAEQIGKPFITTKGGGFGLGLFLSYASVNRAGGSVSLYNHPRGGALTELHLPHQGWPKQGA